MPKGKTQIVVMAKPSSVVVGPPTRTKRQRRRQRPVSLPSSSSGLRMTPEARDYAKTLEDPWENGPVRLGFNTMIPTTLTAGYMRGSTPVGADGSFGILAFPDLVNAVSTNVNAWAAAPNWIGYPVTNATALQNSFSSARVVSMGLRVFPLYAQTAKPGVLFSAMYPETNRLQTGTSTSNLSNGQSIQMGFGSKGARVTTRPVDPGSFEFRADTLTGLLAAERYHVPSLFISGQGFDTTTTIYWEYIINLEAISGLTSSTVSAGLGTLGQADSSAGVLARQYANVESLYSSIKPYLDNPVVMDTVEGLAGALHPALGGGVRIGRSLFGNGKHAHNYITTVRHTTPVIEEMKEDLGRDEL